MLKPRTSHLPKSTAFFCINVDGLDQAKALQRHSIESIFSNMTKRGGGR